MTECSIHIVAPEQIDRSSTEPNALWITSRPFEQTPGFSKLRGSLRLVRKLVIGRCSIGVLSEGREIFGTQAGGEKQKQPETCFDHAQPWAGTLAQRHGRSLIEQGAEESSRCVAPAVLAGGRAGNRPGPGAAICGTLVWQTKNPRRRFESSTGASKPGGGFGSSRTPGRH